MVFAAMIKAAVGSSVFLPECNSCQGVNLIPDFPHDLNFVKSASVNGTIMTNGALVVGWVVD